jgi:hypothetical protein
MLLLKKAYTIYIPLLMMKINFTVIPALFFAVSIFLFPKKNYAQLINNGSIISVTNNAVLYANVSFINMANGSVVNNGSIVTDSSLINNSGAALSGNGNYNMQANFINNGSFNADNSTLIFGGNVTSTIKNKR